jgi:hypothetical protein
MQAIDVTSDLCEVIVCVLIAGSWVLEYWLDAESCYLTSRPFQRLNSYQKSVFKGI